MADSRDRALDLYHDAARNWPDLSDVLHTPDEAKASGCRIGVTAGAREASFGVQ
jgi:hypothetical protein